MSEYAGLIPPETALRSIIDAGLVAIQQNAQILPRLLQRYTDEVKDQFIQYFTKTEIPVRMGFAREDFEHPQVTITLASDNDERFLGDELFVRDRDLGVTAKVGAQVNSWDRAPFALQYTDLVGTLPAQGRIKIGEEYLTYSSVGPGAVLNIAGRGALGSKKTLHEAGAEIGFFQIEYDRGAHNKVNYRVDVLTDNGDVTMVLANMVRAVLLTKMTDLMNVGFSEIAISASDYAPRPAFYPALLQIRTLMFSARVEVAVPEPAVEGLSIEENPEITGTIMSQTPIIGGQL